MSVERLVERRVSPEVNRSLSTVQQQILQLVAEGFSNAEIASKLHATSRMIEYYRNSIREKLDADSTRAAVVIGVAREIINISKIVDAASIERIGKLSKRQKEVLETIASGKSNEETGSFLYITTKTVERHINCIIGALEIRTEDGNSRSGFGNVIRAAVIFMEAKRQGRI